MCCKNGKNEVSGSGTAAATVAAAAALPQRGKKRVRTKLTSFTSLARYDDEHLLLTPLDHEGFRYNRNEVRKKSKDELLHLIQL